MANKSLLLFEDKLGISTGYESIWQSLLIKTGFTSVEINRRNSFRSLSGKVTLLTRSGNRKAPGFNPDPDARRLILQWMKAQVSILSPSVIICMDPALLFAFNPDWNQATLDNLRGGTYKLNGVPVVIMLPITAWHTTKKETDIARMNEGFTDEGEWQEEHGGDETDADLNQLWIEPVSVPFGRWILQADLMKARRILERMENPNDRK